MEITWGDMLFSYNFGEWNSENINYNDSTEQKCGWETPFDGVNNQVTVINHSSNWVDVTLNLALNENQQTPPDNLGFHLTSNNTNDNTDDYPTTAQTLQNGTVGNSTTAYVNIGADDRIPPTDYNTQTPIANITVTMQNTANS